jgi:hypothetical protein
MVKLFSHELAAFSGSVVPVHPPFSLKACRGSLVNAMKCLFLRALCFWFLLVPVAAVPGAVSLVYAQSAQTLRSEITPTSGALDDLFIFTVTYEGGEQRVTPLLQTNADFEVQLLGPKTSVTIINGVLRSQQSFVYQLTPKREGALKTPEVQATTAQGTLSAPPIAVTITSQAGSPSGGAHVPTAPTAGDDLFLSQSAAPKEVYLGQQIVNVIGVYSRLNLQGVTVDDEVADGFWQEVISDNNSSQKTIRGKDYAALELSRALFPLRAGDLTIAPRKGTAKAITMRRMSPGNILDPFSDGFFDSIFQQPVIKDIPLSSNSIPIKVKPLPPIPPELMKFAGGVTLVGDTSIVMDASAAVMKTGDTKAISVTVRTEGNVNPLKTLPLTAPSGMKLYDSPPHTTHRISNGRLVSERTFKYSLVALQPGTARIPGVSVAYFDPHTGEHRLATTSDLTILVSGSQLTSTRSAPDQSQPAPAQNVPSTTQNLIPTLPPLPVAPHLSYREKSVFEAVAERVSVQLSLLILSAVIAIVGLGAVFLSRVRRADQVKSSLSHITNLRDLAEVEAFLRRWLASRFPSLSQTSSLDELRAVVRGSTAERAHVASLLAIIDDLEMERYGRGDPTSISTFHERLRAIVSAWEQK